MNQNTYIINASIDTMQTQKEINVKNKKESDLIEIIEEIGMAETNAYLLYGEPQVGKTRLALKLAEIYSDLGFTPKFIVTEVNWGMKFGGKSMLELVRQKFGADSAYIPRNIENILTLEVPNKPFLVFDSLGSVIYDVITNAMQTRAPSAFYYALRNTAKQFNSIQISSPYIKQRGFGSIYYTHYV